MNINKVKSDLHDYVLAGEDFNTKTKAFLDNYGSLTPEECETLKMDDEVMALIERIDKMEQQSEMH